MDKILYKDGDQNRLLKGKIVKEDELFIHLELDTGKYRIAKSSIISIREVRLDGESKDGFLKR